MLKKYIAKSHVSINVSVGKGKGSVHVSFSPLTDGGSVYYTDREKIQKALEKHPKYGRLFHLDETSKVESPLPPTPPESETGPVPGPKVIEVASLDDAKNYLVDNFGISRTRLRSRKQIEETAAANGIEFIFA